MELFKETSYVLSNTYNLKVVYGQSLAKEFPPSLVFVNVHQCSGSATLTLKKNFEQSTVLLNFDEAEDLAVSESVLFHCRTATSLR